MNDDVPNKSATTVSRFSVTEVAIAAALPSVPSVTTNEFGNQILITERTIVNNVITGRIAILFNISDYTLR